ncbi:MAG: hypothetical protein ACL7BU_12490 [Candidatus Phlomobacter fragariae]
MHIQNMANRREGLLCAQSEDLDVFNLRKAVISGNWSAINNGLCTLTDLGLKHNGNGVVWLNSGVSVHEADSDTGFTGGYKKSYEYQASLCLGRPLENKVFSRGVHSHKVDDYCLLILNRSDSWVEHWNRKNGKALRTFAVQILTNERQDAFDNWVIYRHPRQHDKYTVINIEHNNALVKEYIRHGWLCESTYELSLLAKSNNEFGRLMARLGYIKVRTRKITGHKETFWVYRCAEKEIKESKARKTLCPSNTLIYKYNNQFVQYTKQPVKAFKHIIVDGEYYYVYEDHIHFLTKKRQRIAGKQVTGYTAKAVDMIEIK